MNKGLIIALVAGLAAITAVGGYYVINNNTDTPEATQIPTQETAMENTENPKTLKSLFSMASNQECSFIDSETQSEGMVYIGNGQVRGDFTTISEGASYNSNMYSDSESVFIWLDGQGTGYKISMDTLESFSSDAEDDSLSLDFDNEVDLNCSPWSPNESVFVLPEDVNFQEFSGFVPANVGTGQGELPGVEIDCSTCDQLPAGEAQNACRESLGC